MSKTPFYSLKKTIGFGTVVSSAILNAYGSETFLERSGTFSRTLRACSLDRDFVLAETCVPARSICRVRRGDAEHQSEQFCARTDREVGANADAPFSLNLAANTVAKASSIKNVASSHFADYAASDCDASGQSAAGGVRRRSGSGVVFGNGVPHSAGAKEKARRENGKLCFTVPRVRRVEARPGQIAVGAERGLNDIKSVLCGRDRMRPRRGEAAPSLTIL